MYTNKQTNKHTPSHTHKLTIKGQSVQKIEGKQTDGRTDGRY